jgi:hypothetical protein
VQTRTSLSALNPSGDKTPLVGQRTILRGWAGAAGSEVKPVAFLWDYGAALARQGPNGVMAFAIVKATSGLKVTAGGVAALRAGRARS